MTSAPAPSFTHNYINYKRLRPDSKIFIPLSAFAPQASEESEVGEYMGSLAAGFAEMGAMPGIATALHLIEALEPLNEAQSPAPTAPQARALQYMYNANRVSAPAGRGSRAGIWIDAKTAVELGLITLPKEMPELRDVFANRLATYRAKQEAPKPTPFQTTNEYPKKGWLSRTFGRIS